METESREGERGSERAGRVRERGEGERGQGG